MENSEMNGEVCGAGDTHFSSCSIPFVARLLVRVRNLGQCRSCTVDRGHIHRTE